MTTGVDSGGTGKRSLVRAARVLERYAAEIRHEKAVHDDMMALAAELRALAVALVQFVLADRERRG